MRRVNCVNCRAVYKQKLVDPDTGKDKGHVNMCLCDIAGDCEIGFECGKGHCECYRRNEKEVK